MVQITINNESKDAAFLLHSAFLDYTHWALSGGVDPTAACRPAPVNSQVANCPSQVASVESRVIRGELQDAANWTWRNGLIRAAVLVGTVGSAKTYFFTMKIKKDVPKDCKLTLQVSATGKDGHAVKGDTTQYQVKYTP